MATIFMVNGQEKTLEMRDERGIDWSADFVGNTAHGMQTDSEGRYIASQEDYDWWKDMIEQYQEMKSVIAAYYDKFGDQIHQVVNDAIGGYDLEDQPRNVISALEEVFGKI